MNSKVSKTESLDSNSKQPDVYADIAARREQLLVQVAECRVRQCDLSEQAAETTRVAEGLTGQILALRGAIAVLDELLSNQKPVPK